ncbi:permease 2-keto-3-deoxygluconate membrane transmembrane sugar kdg symport inner 2-keto-3-deoxy-d-gluconate system [Lucifera butyrica]|uniref:2-keto-3-deoxygluconate permease n=1 Tax=Lucifera butyrica TaxID=1351585 RepID=A0A498RAF0_9FIRM|nr:2-keto-3-deoxygluconate permease [Lucifera butyrica]VBB09676.1 permease 2-keto-3-deoxygluconate membrane transmembrane sugar kdg symport inner 2-keto-3-deoxy-d-gluconate system [Lucifera butyrica]
MKIMENVQKVPGGMMLVPLLLGATLTTLAPGTAKFFGSFTAALMTGILPILAVFFFCMGATIDFRSSWIVLRKSGALVGTKVLFAALMGMIASHFIPPAGITSGFFAGLSVLAIVASMNDTNGGLYMALMNQYGTQEEASAYALMTLESGPFMTMVTLGVAGLGNFPWQAMLGAILPFLIGFLLGNLDHDIRSFLGKAVPVFIPFFAFALGNGLNFKVIANTGLLGILLGVTVVVLTGSVLLVADFLTGGNGRAGVAAASTAGAAVGVPVVIAAIDPKFTPVVASATALIATSVLVTAIITPILTGWWARKFNNRSPFSKKLKVQQEG